jgi:thiol-disulfide isomerase/thioredoxin
MCIKTEQKTCFLYHFTLISFLVEYQSVFIKMKIIFILFASFLIISISQASEIKAFVEYDPSYRSGWKQLMKGNTVIMFHAPWCTTCHKILPKLAEYAKENSANIKFYSMDCSKPTNTDICLDNGVSSFPVLNFLKNGNKQGEGNYIGKQYRTFIELISKN